ncbi:MAG: HIT domain-containing protein [Rhodobacteraceae bacterium]|nr:HIT domain-containing protein [Paracoccaceae bacterium]
MTEFRLDPRLENDSVPLVDFGLCSVRLMKDGNYPWLVMIPRKNDVTEIIDLAPIEQIVLMEEIGQVSKVLKSITACQKLNVAALGNMVPQLHVHVIARFESDAAWPGPVWGAVPARAYEAQSLEDLVEGLQIALLG